jgi:sugar/nucleoside kinase (ribokinase family)
VLHRVEVVDTVGAGDNCTAGVIAALLAGAPLQAAVECGCAAGTAAVQSAGGVLSDADASSLSQRVGDIMATALRQC